jgi:hypothetical protein
MTKRKKKPETVHDMAYRRGLAVHKAKRGGWYVTLAGAPWAGVLYAAHTWPKVVAFVRTMPRIIRMGDA